MVITAFPAPAVPAALAAVCPAGSYVTDDGACEDCPAGKVNAAINATNCRTCPGDMVANAGQTDCYCPVPGTEQVGIGTCGEPATASF
jgi:hypothetical protein